MKKYCLLLPLIFISCVSLQTNLSAEQRLYAAYCDYIQIGALAADYCESEIADPNVVSKIKTVDKIIFESLEGLRQANEAGSNISNGLEITENLIQSWKEMIQ